MADYSVTKEELTGIASAIKEKGRTTETLEFPNEFETAINKIISSEEFMSVSEVQHLVIKRDSIRKCSCYGMHMKDVDAPTLTIIPVSCFEYNIRMQTINIPNVTRIETRGMAHCEAIKELKIPKSDIVADQGCYHMDVLERVDANFRHIYPQAFRKCRALTTLILRRDAVATLDNIDAFALTPIESGTGYIYVPKALVEQYKVAPNWATYANQIRAIEDYPDITGGVI